MRAEASAPSNIALIKYMGKASGSGNLPANASLSYTLEHLRSFVVIEALPASATNDEWAPLEGFQAIQLSDVGLSKFLGHFSRLKSQWGLPGCYVVRSANNFPSDCGLASSASSFAALTSATYNLAREMNPILNVDVKDLSALSRQGSGSSCRSFFAPWATWSGAGAEPVLDLDLRLDHAVIVVDGGKKTVSSSEAHGRVATSLLWAARPERASWRLGRLTEALKSGDWARAFEITWAEFWDMHALFETSEPAFGYMTPETLRVLERLRSVWRAEGDGPLVTMDAGANIHVLLRRDQIERAEDWLSGLQTLRSWHD